MAEVTTIKHRFLKADVNPQTENLIIGTFNPETPTNSANIFYGRARNYLWKLLPSAFGQQDLTAAPLEAKREFLQAFRIDFIDLISELTIDIGQEANFADRYLDGAHKIVWRDIVGATKSLPLKRAFVTRKTFSDVPNIKSRVEDLEAKLAVPLLFLPTPARFYNEKKQLEWNAIIQSAAS